MVSPTENIKAKAQPFKTMFQLNNNSLSYHQVGLNTTSTNKTTYRQEHIFKIRVTIDEESNIHLKFTAKQLTKKQKIMIFPYCFLIYLFSQVERIKYLSNKFHSSGCNRLMGNSFPPPGTCLCQMLNAEN